MAILYQTTKFKSANILAIAILGSTAKFNSRQYFWLCSISLKVRPSLSHKIRTAPLYIHVPEMYKPVNTRFLIWKQSLRLSYFCTNDDLRYSFFLHFLMDVTVHTCASDDPAAESSDWAGRVRESVSRPPRSRGASDWTRWEQRQRGPASDRSAIHRVWRLQTLVHRKGRGEWWESVCVCVYVSNCGCEYRIAGKFSREKTFVDR